MARNKLIDLNNHLFEQLERLNDDELKGEELEQEIQRSRAITSVASQIISNGNLILNAKKHADEYGNKKEMPNILLGDGK